MNRDVAKAHRLRVGPGTAGTPTDLITVYVTCSTPQGLGAHDCALERIEAHASYLGPGTDEEPSGSFSGTSCEEFWAWVKTRLRRNYEVMILGHSVWHEVVSHLRLDQFVSGDGWTVDRQIVNRKLCSIAAHRLGRVGEPGFARPVTKDEKKNQYRIQICDIQQWNIGGTVTDLVEEFKGDPALAMMRAFHTWVDEVYRSDLGFFKNTPSGQGWSLFTNRFYCPKVKKGKYEHETEQDEFHPERIREKSKQIQKVEREMRHIYIPDRPDVLALEARAAAFGPVVEVYRHGLAQEPVAKVDVNAAYLWVQQNCSLPTRCTDYSLGPERLSMLSGEHGSQTQNAISYLHRLITDYDYLAIADVEVEVTGTPWVPRKFGEQTVFTQGKFRTTLTTPELLKAFDEGIVTQVFEANLYDHQPFLAEYSAFIEERRNNTTGFIRRIYKLMGNAPHGKFAQEYEEWQDADEEMAELLQELRQDNGGSDTISWFEEDGTVRDIQTRVIFGTWQYCESLKYTEHTFKAVSAHILAYARLRIREYQEIAGRDNCYYTHTDSIIVNSEGLCRLIEEDALSTTIVGKLKMENELTSNVRILAPGVYDFNDGNAGHAGIPSNLGKDSTALLRESPQVALARNNPYVPHTTRRLYLIPNSAPA